MGCKQTVWGLFLWNERLIANDCMGQMEEMKWNSKNF